MAPVWEYLSGERNNLLYSAYQHLSMVVQAVALATVIALVLAVLVTRVPKLDPVANAVSAVGLTIPSFALLGLLLPLLGIGVAAAFPAITFYAVLPILRNAVVGLAGVDKTLLESARGMGLNAAAVLLKVQIPLAWPVILAGIRVSAQMSMGVAAIAAYVLGPGLGSYIFTGLAQVGGADAVHSALTGTVGIVILALLLDGALLLLARMTTSEGIRA
jgi:osmoprotectant transport system permease protein